MRKKDELIKNHNILQAISECVEGIYMIEEDTKEICFLNDELKKKYGESAIGKQCYEIFEGRSEQCSDCPLISQQLYQWERYDKRSKRWVSIKNRLVTEDGVRYRVGNINAIQDIMGLNWETVDEISYLSRKLSEQIERKKELLWEANHDAMTGLHSKNCFIKDCKEIYEAEKSLGIIFIDINNLKECNDLLGHEFGDRMIITVAGIIQQAEDKGIRAYRFGGDEFLIAVAGLEFEMIKEIENKIIMGLNKCNEKSTMKIQVAMGSSFRREGDSLDEIVERADFAMYKDKKRQKEMRKTF